MRYLTTYSPSRWEQPSILDGFDRLLSDLWREPVSTNSYDVSENENAYVINMDAPGLKKEDLKIEVAGRTLTISGERKHETRGTRKLNASFNLPEQVDSEKIEAHFTDGVLYVTVPKTPEVKPRLIEIQ